MSGGRGAPERPAEDRHLTVKVEGIVLPRSFALGLLVMTIISAALLLLGVFYCRDLAREIRVLQLHVQDLEAVEIRSGDATRDDFADWGEAPLRTRPPAREKENP